MDKPTSLASLKSYLQKGVKMELVETEKGQPVEKLQGVRTVKTVQTNAITFIKDGGVQSWLYHEPANHYTFTNEGFTVKDPDQPYFLRYEYR